MAQQAGLVTPRELILTSRTQAQEKGGSFTDRRDVYLTPEPALLYRGINWPDQSQHLCAQQHVAQLLAESLRTENSNNGTHVRVKDEVKRRTQFGDEHYIEKTGITASIQ